jgi:transposase
MTDARLQVRVLLDTGPTLQESTEIEEIFGDLGMRADVEGHSYGGPPPTSAFLIVVNTDLLPFMDTFLAQGPSGRHSFERWAGRLLALRSDSRMWGKQHTLKLEDAQCGLSIALTQSLSAAAYDTILNIDLSGFDRGSPATAIEWDPSLNRWQAHLRSAPRPIARRVALRSGAATDTPRVRNISDEDLRAMWRLSEDPDVHAVTWQRAKMVLWSTFGWSPSAIAEKMLVTEHCVRTVIDNFNADALSSLVPVYSGRHRPPLSGNEEREVRQIAARHPDDFGVPLRVWDIATLSDFLVSQGIVDDISYAQLVDLVQEMRHSVALDDCHGTSTP